MKDRTGTSSGESGGAAAPDAGDDLDPRVASFLRGVTIGALVGAAIAGSALWERAMRRRAADAAPRGDDAPSS